MVDIHVRKLMWVYCPGHARVKGNDRADRLAGKAAVTSGLLLERSEVLRSLRHCLRAQRQRLWLEERGLERGSARRSSLKGREKAIVNQTNTGTVSKATLGKLLRDGVEHIIMGFSERRYHHQRNGTEVEQHGRKAPGHCFQKWHGPPV